jgi:DNA-3-methyladenine glycosylase II
MQPAYWNRARRSLAARDPRLAAIIARHPRVALRSRGEPFVTLARSIVGQQISVAAADTIWRRLEARLPALTPHTLVQARSPSLRACGLSARKVEYLKDLARHFRSGHIDPARFAAMTDAEIIAELTAVRGIGRWTVEMLLIFNLMRPDVLPLDDIGLLRAIARHYFDDAPSVQLKTAAGRQRVTLLAEAWQPWRTVATWYLWRSLDPLPVEY